MVSIVNSVVSIINFVGNIADLVVHEPAARLNIEESEPFDSVFAGAGGSA